VIGTDETALYKPSLPFVMPTKNCLKYFYFCTFEGIIAILFGKNSNRTSCQDNFHLIGQQKIA
jgi:hypothetical protein